MGKFEIKKDKAGEFRFNLKAGNGQVILSSEGYKAKASCMNGIESVRKNSQVDSNFERKDSNGNYRFNLKSTNSQVIGTSESYTSSAAMENGIASVKANAPEATIEDNS
ncbi:MAG TPA: YegP family protein [Gillisia sp.]|nr:YegP family protein [Gillisia sp.]